MELQQTQAGNFRVLLGGLWYIRFCNIFILDDTSSHFWQLFPLIYKIPSLVVFYLSITLYFAMVFLGKIHSEDNVSFMLAVWINCLQALNRTIILVSKKKEIKSVILQLGDIQRTWDHSEEQIKKKNVLFNSLNFRYAVLQRSITITAWIFLLLPLCRTVLRTFIHQDSELRLPFNCFYPFDPTRDWFTYLVVYALQVYSILNILYLLMGCEIVQMALISYLSSEFTLLQYDFENLDPTTSLNRGNIYGGGQNQGKSIWNLIRKHQKLLRAHALCEAEHLEEQLSHVPKFCKQNGCYVPRYTQDTQSGESEEHPRLSKDLDNILNGIVFVNFGSSTIMTACFLLSTIEATILYEKIENYLAVIVITYQMYNVCFQAELMKEASLGIGDAAYRNPWYKGNRPYIEAIRLVIMRSQSPCYLTSMKYNKISLRSFVKILRTIWSYNSLAISIHEE